MPRKANPEIRTRATANRKKRLESEKLKGLKFKNPSPNNRRPYRTPRFTTSLV